MQKIKLDPIATLLVVLVIILAFHILIQYLRKVSSKEEEIKDEIEKSLFKLNMAQEKRKDLKEDAAKRFKQLSVAFFILFGALISSMTWFGVSYIDALEGVTGTIAVTFFMYTWVVYRKIGVNQFLDMLKHRVQIHTYKKNGFDPKVIDQLQSSIENNKEQLKRVQENSMTCSTSRILQVNKNNDI